MRIILNEIKKIFYFKRICLLILGSLLIYKMFISFELDYFPNGRPELDVYNITVEMINNYGNEMDDIELEDLKNIYKNKLKEADEFFINNEDFNQVGVYSYEDYENKCSCDTENQKFNDINWKYLKKDEGDILWELQELPGIIELYEDRNTNYYSEYGNCKKHEERVNDIISSKENQSILSYLVFNNYNNLIKDLGICVIIGIAFILTPLFLKDKKDKIDYLQYSSKCGRQIFKSKLIAGVISAIIIITIEIIIFFILYRGNNTSMFFNSNINSVLNDEFWISITFFQYILLTIVALYIIGIITAFISMFISSKVNTYISSIGMQVPILFIIGGLTTRIFLNNLFKLSIPKYLTPFTYFILIIIAVIITTTSIRKVRVTDIRN